LAGAYNATIHVAGDCNMPGLAITSDGTADGSDVFNDLSVTNQSITTGNDVHHEADQSLREAGTGVGSGTDTAYNALAIDFDGTDDYLTVPNHADFHMGSGDFTVDYWFRPANLTGDQQVFDHNYRLYDEWYSSNMLVKLHDDTGRDWHIGVASHGLVINTWNHVAYVRAGTRWMVFINGRLRKELDIGTASLDSSPAGYRARGTPESPKSVAFPVEANVIYSIILTFSVV
jgi:hypothetical protein